jgi:hypothetical protein
MSIPGLGDALTLFDLSIRITTFINDLRHAQDDFLGLRAEADCLRICINSLNSPHNLETLYNYISQDQGRDLKSIVDTCELNMVELNKFVASSAKIVEDDVTVCLRVLPFLSFLPPPSFFSFPHGLPLRVRVEIGELLFFVSLPHLPSSYKKNPTPLHTTHTETDGFFVGFYGQKKGKFKGHKGGSKFRALIAKAWARFRFTMTDKQPFRDKLVLPTASINVFLTSLTHVGLANVGRLMVSSGHLPVNAGHGGGQALGGGWGAITGGGGAKGEIAKVEGINGWEVVGRRVAFKENFVRAWELTEEIEEGVLEYVKYLMQGGQPLYVKTTDGGEAGGRYRITKTTKTRKRSRSRSRGPLGLVKESRSGQMYVMRKKSVSRPSTERIEIVERDYTSRPEGEGGHGKFLALPAPPAPEILNVRDERQPLYVERMPKESSSDGSDGGGSDSVGDSAGSEGHLQQTGCRDGRVRCRKERERGLFLGGQKDRRREPTRNRN